MAENKEITTLHPYMNRNKNRYPNVKEENIPDTIQRKLTAGTGISISPENVISATGGDSYTRSETDALLDTKADKTALDNAEKVIPTDIAVKNGKIGLEHDTTWLTNQNAITLGDGLTYDEATKTLKASGGKGGISVIELTDKNGTIASTQLGEINANPQNFAFKYKGKILLFTSADSTTYQYCNNTTNSSENNVMTTSTLLTITSNTGVYTIAENVHNVVANSIHPANGGDLTNIQVGSKVYSIPSGGGEAGFNKYQIVSVQQPVYGTDGEHTYTIGERLELINYALTPPSDYNDGLPVLLATSCNNKNAVASAVGRLKDTTGDNIYYVVSAEISKSESNHNYYLSAQANAINTGTANKNPHSTGSYLTVVYAWIYK